MKSKILPYLSRIFHISAAFLSQHPLGLGILGALTSLCFAPFFVWPLFAVIYSTLFAFICRAEHQRSVAIGSFAFGVGMYLSNFYWLYSGVHFFVQASTGDIAQWIIESMSIAIMLVFLLSLAIPLMVMCILFWRFHNRFTPALQPWFFAACILAAEYLRGFPFWPFLPWNMSGYAVANTLPLLQIAALGGTGFLSFIILACAASFTNRHDAARAITILCLCFLFGSMRLAAAPDTSAHTGTAHHIRMVQTNYSSSSDASASGRLHKFLDYLSVSKDPVDLAPELIIWPEGAVKFVVENEPAIHERINAIPQELIFGSLVMEEYSVKKTIAHPNAQGRMVTVEELEQVYFNTVRHKKARQPINPVDQVQKRIAVPVGEKLPLYDFFKEFYKKALPHFVSVADAPDEHPPYLKTSLGTALVLNCYEALFARIIWKYSDDADYILHMSNASWYRDTHAVEQFYYATRLRAIAAGKPLIRVSNAGIGGMFDAYGRILYRFEPDPLPLPYDMTVYDAALVSAPSLFPQRD